MFNLKEVRKKKGLSQEQLVSKSGVSRSIISGLESGRISVTTTATLAKLAKALNTKIDDFFCP